VLKRLLIGTSIAGLALVVMAAAGIGWWLHRADLVALLRAQAAASETMTGRVLALRGPVSIRLWPRPSIVAQDVALANASWGSVPQMLVVERVEGQLAWSGLLRGAITISRLALSGVQVSLETGPAGEGNWLLQPGARRDAGSAERAAEGGGGLVVEIEALTVSDGRIDWLGPVKAKQTPRQLAVQTLAVDALSRAQASLRLAARLDGQPFEITGRVPGIAAWSADGGVRAVDATLAAPGLTAQIKGELPASGGSRFSLEIAGRVEQTQALSRVIAAASGLPVPVSIAARVGGTSSAFTVEPLALTFARGALRGKVDYREAGKRPHLSATLTADEIDLGGAPAGARGTAAAAAPGQRTRRLFPDTPLPFERIAALDGELKLRIGVLRLANGVVVRELSLDGRAHAGELQLTADRFTLAEGQAQGRLEVQAARNPPAVRLNATASQLNLGQLLTRDGRAPLSGGPTDASIDYRGTGRSPRALAASADGELRVAIGPARVTAAGLEFGGDALLRVFSMVNPFHKSDGVTELQCAAIRLPAQSGLITVRQSLAYQTSKVSVVAFGTIDLRNESLDLVIRPTIREGLGIGPGQLAELVRLTGNLRSPSVGLDTIGALRTALSVGGALATSGLSLLAEGLLRRGTADPAPCRTALGQAPAASPAGATVEGALGSVRRWFGLGR
jgi:AsmA family protein